MEVSVHQYFEAGLAPATRKTYSAGIKKYIHFCSLSGITDPLQVSQQILCYFIAYLANNGLSSSTIKTYLASIRYMLIAHDKSPPAWATMPKLKMVLAGIQRVLAFSKQPRPRLPITPLILSQLRSLWLSRAHEYNIIMLWAVCCTCFFAWVS